MSPDDRIIEPHPLTFPYRLRRLERCFPLPFLERRPKKSLLANLIRSAAIQS
jgi:hypothetical protein